MSEENGKQLFGCLGPLLQLVVMVAGLSMAFAVALDKVDLSDDVFQGLVIGMVTFLLWLWEPRVGGGR